MAADATKKINGSFAKAAANETQKINGSFAKVVTDTTHKIAGSFAKVVADMSKKKLEPLPKWRPTLLKGPVVSVFFFPFVFINTNACLLHTQLLIYMLCGMETAQMTPDTLMSS